MGREGKVIEGNCAYVERRSKFGDRIYQIAGPAVRNNLPTTLGNERLDLTGSY
jgi:hypothetical protein